MIWTRYDVFIKGMLIAYYGLVCSSMVCRACRVLSYGQGGLRYLQGIILWPVGQELQDTYVCKVTPRSLCAPDTQNGAKKLNGEKCRKIIKFYDIFTVLASYQ